MTNEFHRKTNTLFPRNRMTTAELKTLTIPELKLPDRMVSDSTSAMVRLFPGKRVSVFLWTSLVIALMCIVQIMYLTGRQLPWLRNDTLQKF